MKKHTAAIAALLLAAFFALPAAAAGEMPDTSTYVYSDWKKPVSAPPAFETEQILSANSLGVAIGKLSDVCTDGAGNVYLLDAGKNQLIRLDAGYHVKNVVTTFDFNGGQSFNEPQGLFFSETGRLYVADTQNERLVIFDENLRCVQIVEKPSADAKLDYQYEPTKVCADRSGNIYVISQNQTKGILQFSAAGKFIGYLGATRVVPDMTEMFFRMFATRTQLKSMLRSIPTEYNNLTLDDNGFVYGTVASLNAYTILSDIASNGSAAAPVRLLNPNGDDILVRNGQTPPVGDILFNVAYGSKALYDGPSKLVDVAYKSDGIYSLLDANRGRVFTYDAYGELLYIFGSRGSNEGQFDSPCGLTYQGDRLLVADNQRNEVTVLAPTGYASNIMLALHYYQTGDYDQELSFWQKVLDQYSGSEIAYVGLGKAYYNNKDYTKALTYFEKGNNRTYYSKALKEQRRLVGQAAAPWVLGVLAVIVLSGLAYMMLRRKGVIRRRAEPAVASAPPGRFRQTCIMTLDGMKYGFYICVHPFAGFWDMKHERRGNVYSATAILVLTVIMNILTIRCTPYLFNNTNFSETNVLLTGAISIAGPLALWCAANWCMTSLMDGKGKAKDIYMFTCYALFPRLILYPPLLVISFMMSLDEATFYSLVVTCAAVWLGFLIFSGTLVIHEFTGGKTLLAILLSIVGICIIVFLGILVVSLVQQIYVFIRTLLLEVTLRS